MNHTILLTNKRTISMKTKRNVKRVHFNSNCTSDRSYSQSLKEVLSDLLLLFNEYAEKNDISSDERSKFEKFLYEFYLEKKAEDYLNCRVLEVNSYVNRLLKSTFSNVFTEDTKDQYDIFYYNKKHHLMSHE